MENDPPAAHPPPAPDDYYMEGEYMVFTAAYHLKRGSCCNSGCRHCPYGFREQGKSSPATPSSPNKTS